MPSLQISGVTLDFPKEPYECQINYMQKVIQAISSGSNALLESPTGTGKTLCLLCSSIAWQMQNNKPLVPLQENKSNNNSNKGSSKSDPLSTPPSNVVIIYATRTHSQLHQVIRELNSTTYRPKMTVLGSREQLCINNKFAKLKGSAMNHACTTLNSRRGCHYRNNLDGYGDGSATSVSPQDVMDIEDLTKIGIQRSICPYYFSRDLSASADVIFMPYNYLLDASIRKTTRIPFQNAVVIFDEAHNLEQVAADAASCSFSSADIAACIKELQQVLKILSDDMKTNKVDKEMSNNTISKADSSNGDQKPNPHLTAHVLKAMFALESQLDRVTLEQHTVIDKMCAVHPGKWLVELIFQVGFNSDQCIDTVKKCGNFLIDQAEEALLAGDVGGGPSGHVPEPKLNLFATALERILYTGRLEHQDFQVYISDVDIKPPRGGMQGGTLMTYYQDPGHRRTKKRVVEFYCFSTGVALKELKKLGVRSLILTSGTLSPMEAMKEELKLPFPIELQNPHVIKNNQVFISAVGKGNSGEKLNSSYSNRSNTAYKDELGQSILEIACSILGKTNTSVLPSNISSTIGPTIASTDMPKLKGGLLVFFPAYHIMENVIERWKLSKLYDKLVSVGGKVIIETKTNPLQPNNNSNSSSSNNNYSSSVKENSSFNKKVKSLSDDENNEEEEAILTNLVKDFERTIATKGSCILIGVCRGKVAEGVDFSDNKGRVVVITGIPFAPYMDPKVALKKVYLDQKTITNSLPPPVPSESSLSSSINFITPAVAPAPVTNIAGAGNNIWANAIANALPPAPTPSNAPVPRAAQRTSKGSLTGQMWYNQSAARAVNQCLGRVIRHRNDWGAIFLLDERFLVDGQINQISQWMRPLIRKTKSIQEALLGFKHYLAHIVQDISLHTYIQTDAAANSTLVNVNPKRPKPATTEPIRQDPFTRFIEISETELPSSTQEPACFIQQQLLSSQHNQTIRVYSDDNNDYNTFLKRTQSKLQSSSSQINIMDDHKKKTASNLDLGAKLALLKANKETQQPNHLLVNQSSKLMGSKANNINLNPLLDLTTLSNGGQIIVLDQDEDGGEDQFGLSQPTPFSQTSAILSQGTVSQENKPKVSFSVFSQAFKSTSSSALGAKKISNSGTNSPEGQVLALLGQLKVKVSSDIMSKLKALFAKVKSQGGLQYLTQVKSFQEEFIGIVNEVLSLEEQTQILRAMKILVNSSNSSSSSAQTLADRSLEKLRELYIQMVNQRYERLLKKRRLEASDIKDELAMLPPPRQPIPIPNQANSAVTQNSTNVSNSAQISQLQDQDEKKPNGLALGSSRAQEILQRSQGAGAAKNIVGNNNSSVLSKLQQVSDLAIDSNIHGFKPIAGAVLKSSNKLLCCICNDTAVEPCAGSCGHVCCSNCWSQWLKVNARCPYCRAPASIGSVSKLLVRASTN